jgi:hypothetical protein
MIASSQSVLRLGTCHAASIVDKGCKTHVGRLGIVKAEAAERKGAKDLRITVVRHGVANRMLD